MSVKYGKFEMPSKISVEEVGGNPNHVRFVAEPFERGFGHTIGNSMRRMIMTSLEAPAFISVRIEGAPHEYMAIDGIVEDMTNIILNFKGSLLRKLPTDDNPGSHEVRILTSVVEVTQDDLDKNKGSVVVKLKDVVPDGNYEVVNPEHKLFTVTKPTKRQIDMRVAIGRGYVPSERHLVHDKTADEILLDSAFSPVRLVNYFVENTRVGQDTDFDRLILEVTTDGRVSAHEAVSFASQIGLRHFEVFNKVKAHTLSFQEGENDIDGDQDEIMEKLILRIDEIELSVRSTNCLSGASIETIAELVTIPERKMLEFRNFGKKSLNEIKAKLTEMGMHLGMDLSRYGITCDNVKEKIRAYIEEKKGKKEKSREEDRYKDKEEEDR
jgi:DNA-directed RNA polymerase subunit alpha